MLDQLASLFRWPLVMAPLLLACFVLMLVLFWFEWREARRDCGEQSSERNTQGLRVVRGHR